MAVTTFPPSAGGGGATAGELRRFVPDAAGLPPSGWAWRATADIAYDTNYAAGDVLTSGASGLAATEAYLFSASVRRTYSSGTRVELADGSLLRLNSWPAGYTQQRVAAVEVLTMPDGSVRAIVLSVGTVAGATTACCHRFTRIAGATGVDPTLADMHTLAFDGLDVLGTRAALVIAGEHLLAAVWNLAGYVDGFVAIDSATGVLSRRTVDWSSADIGRAYNRCIAAVDGLALFVDSTTRLVYALAGLHITASDGLGCTASAIVGVFAPLTLSPGDYTIAPEAAVAVAVGPQEIVLSTAYGLWQVLREGPSIAARQVAAAHALSQRLQFGMCTAAHLQAYPASGQTRLRFEPARHATTGYLDVLDIDYTAARARFSRDAIKL